MKKVVILRHGESEWNRLNLFTGLVDVDLSSKGVLEAKNAGQLMGKNGFEFDHCYTSYLKRAIDTLNLALKEMDREWLPVTKDYRLNERHYGALQGLNKEETAKKYGAEQVHIWRRSFDVRPPLLSENSPYNPRKQYAYHTINPQDLPMGESLEDTIKRTVPYFENEIKPNIKAGGQILIAAHGNSLRSLIKYFEQLSDQKIVGVEIPTGLPICYEFDDDFKFIRKYALTD